MFFILKSIISTLVVATKKKPKSPFFFLHPIDSAKDVDVTIENVPVLRSDVSILSITLFSTTFLVQRNKNLPAGLE